MSDTPVTDTFCAAFKTGDTPPSVVFCQMAALERENSKLRRQNVRMESDAYRGDDDEKRQLRSQNTALREKLDYIRGLGEVYSYPTDWNCMKEGGHPPIDAYQRIDLAEVASEPDSPHR